MPRNPFLKLSQEELAEKAYFVTTCMKMIRHGHVKDAERLKITPEMLELKVSMAFSEQRIARALEFAIELMEQGIEIVDVEETWQPSDAWREVNLAKGENHVEPN